jgi:hypothetical protein
MADTDFIPGPDMVSQEVTKEQDEALDALRAWMVQGMVMLKSLGVSRELSQARTSLELTGMHASCHITRYPELGTTPQQRSKHTRG